MADNATLVANQSLQSIFSCTAYCGAYHMLLQRIFWQIAYYGTRYTMMYIMFCAQHIHVHSIFWCKAYSGAEESCAHHVLVPNIFCCTAYSSKHQILVYSIFWSTAYFGPQPIVVHSVFWCTAYIMYQDYNLKIILLRFEFE